MEPGAPRWVPSRCYCGSESCQTVRCVCHIADAGGSTDQRTLYLVCPHIGHKTNATLLRVLLRTMRRIHTFTSDRFHNSLKPHRVLFREGSMSQTELAFRTGISRSRY